MEYEVSPEFLPRNLSGRPLAFILMVWIPAALSGLVTTLRLYARMSRSAASWDDLLMSMSMVRHVYIQGFLSQGTLGIQAPA